MVYATHHRPLCCESLVPGKHPEWHQRSGRTSCLQNAINIGTFINKQVSKTANITYVSWRVSQHNKLQMYTVPPALAAGVKAWPRAQGRPPASDSRADNALATCLDGLPPRSQRSAENCQYHRPPWLSIHLS